MLNSGILRTTTFRLTTVFGLVFAVGIGLLLGMVYVQTATYLTHRVDLQLRAEADTLERSGPETIIRRFQIESARDPLNSFGLFTPAGDRVAGDARLRPAGVTLDGEPRDVPRREGVSPGRALAERTPWDEVLVVERDTRQLMELRRIILGALLWSGAVIVILGLISGVALSIRPLRRIQAMQLASDAITSGDFSMRLPVDEGRDELDQLARMVNRMMDEAERLMVQARTVGEGVAHELRTPLTRLRALIDHACQDLDWADPRRRLLEQCVAETDVVLSRFRALLRIAALESRGRHRAVATVSLSGVIEQIAELYEPLAAERELTLESNSEGEITVRADGELLFEAVSNLVDNALKFTPAGGRVQLRVSTTPAGALIEIADNGAGIAPAERSLVTKRFYRGHEKAGVQGHGLGLSLVAAVADLHGCELSFHDAEPGLIVRILFRRAAGL